MAQFYKVLEANPLGEPWTPNQPEAKPIQNFWCKLEGVDKDVSIGKQVPNILSPGEQVYGELMYAKSQKGTEYWKFKSSKVPEGVTRPASTPAQAVAQQATGRQIDMSATMPDWFKPWANVLLDIQKTLKGDGFDAAPEPVPAPVETPMSEEEIASIKGLFAPELPEEGEPVTPEEE